jgi:glycosyltransferase involved in cell wall biosynthesis
MSSEPLFEVRIPSYERPSLLRRALDSLIGQTYPHWSAVVFDDSQSNAIQQLTSAIEDKRIRYERNRERLGAARNIDQCFAPAPLCGGDWACLLEDDNYWLPEYLARASRSVGRHACDLALANQRVHDEIDGLLDPTHTTRGSWFQPGMITPLELRARLLLMEGVSNGGLLWSLQGGIDLRVGPDVKETGLHEACRSLLVGRPFLFVEQPYAVWSSMAKDATARAGERNRTIGRGNQGLRDFVLRTHGVELLTSAERTARQLGLLETLRRNVAHCGHRDLLNPREVGIDFPILRAALKGYALRLVEADPCADFFKRGRPARISSEIESGASAIG